MLKWDMGCRRRHFDALADAEATALKEAREAAAERTLSERLHDAVMLHLLALQEIAARCQTREEYFEKISAQEPPIRDMHAR